MALRSDLGQGAIKSTAGGCYPIQPQATPHRPQSPRMASMALPYLVRDIHPGSEGSSLYDLVGIGNTLYFAADDGSTGLELWKSDGTSTGTVLVKDINPGPSRSRSIVISRSTALGDTLYFAGTDGTTGYELWKSDGTSAGTVLVKDINPGPVGGTDLFFPKVVGDTIYFMADNGTSGEELWKSDGTSAGTFLVKDILPGAFSSLPYEFSAIGDTLYFSADDGNSGRELWKSDGTSAGTVLVKDINPGPADSLVLGTYRRFAALGDTLYFSADDGNSGLELWKSDGTSAGTVLVKDINAGLSSSTPTGLMAVGDTLYFSADDGNSGRELWKSDGTSAGTVLVKDIAPGPTDGLEPSTLLDGLTALSNTLYFSADDGNSGRELWKSDGTSPGTVLVKDINAGLGSSFPGGLTAVGNTLYFSAEDGSSGRELWKSNGTSTGTLLVEDLYSGPNSSYPLHLSAVGDTVYFRANDGTTGVELWSLAPVPPPTTVSVSLTASGDEADGSPMVFTFEREGDALDLSDELTVIYHLYGTAKPGSDFSGAASGSVSFAANETTTTLELPVLVDMVVDPGDTLWLSIDSSPDYVVEAGLGFALGVLTAEGVTATLRDQIYTGKTHQEKGNYDAFAALREDGSVVTWGEAGSGGDSSAVTPALGSEVVQIYSTIEAFAALKEDGSVVTWGAPTGGGDSSAVAVHLSSGVTSISSTQYAFSALREDGSVVTWGRPDAGGDSSAVSTSLTSGVREIYTTDYAFAALKEDGSVVTWGDPDDGGDSSAVADDLASGVGRIYSTEDAFAAQKIGDDSVITWGRPGSGGDSSAVADKLRSDVRSVASNARAFAALKQDGSVVTWGSDGEGGDSSAVADQLSSGVSYIASTGFAFAALKDDGSVVTWTAGNSYGGDSSAVATDLASGVVQIFANLESFAALKDDGSVITWGYDNGGGDSTSVAVDLASGVTWIFSTIYAFAALKDDGSVVTWGDVGFGGDSSAVAGELTSGVTKVFANERAFAALKEDGSVITWGADTLGGDSSAVASELASGVVGFADVSTDDVLTNDDLEVTHDFGDAPAPYPTLLEEDGARHALMENGPFFAESGTLFGFPDAEADGQPTLEADGDDNNNVDDEDKTSFVILEGPYIPGQRVRAIGFEYDTAALETYINLWIDWNQDGDWEDAGEHIFDDLSLRDFLGDDAEPGFGDRFRGSYDDFILVPADAALSTTYVRARISSQPGLGVTGPAPDGEVEDFTIIVDAPEISITGTDMAVVEGDAGSTLFTIELTRLAPPGDPFGLDYESSVDLDVMGTGAGQADGSDFVGGDLPSLTVTFPAVQTSGLTGTAESEETTEAQVISVEVEIQGDLDVEPDETFIATLSNPVSAQIGSDGATSEVNTILNDDFFQEYELTITALDASKDEGDAGITDFLFAVTLADLPRFRSAAPIFMSWNRNSLPPPSELEVTYRVSGSGDDPADAEDFAGGVFPSGTILFENDDGTWEGPPTLVIPVAGDTDVEADETFTVTLSLSPMPGDTSGELVSIPEPAALDQMPVLEASANGLILNDDEQGGGGGGGDDRDDEPSPEDGCAPFNIANVLNGTNGSDLLIGTSKGEFIRGFEEDDVLRGEGGSDDLRGNQGNDLIRGGDCNDTIHGGVDQDSLRGNSGNDFIYGEFGDDNIRGGGGDDFSRGGVGADVVIGELGDDFLNGNSGLDFVHGRSGSDAVHGGMGDDVVRGGSGNDEVFGDQGNDQLFGDRGDDYLDAGGGDDVIACGGGRDVVQLSSGNDVVVDFDIAFDLIAASADQDASFSQMGNDLLITHTAGSMLLLNVELALFEASSPLLTV